MTWGNLSMELWLNQEGKGHLDCEIDYGHKEHFIYSVFSDVIWSVKKTTELVDTKHVKPPFL